MTFSRLGVKTAQHPIPVILISLLITSLGCIGLGFIKIENNAIKLWIPQQSDFTKNYNWLYENYPPEFRAHSVIVHGEDILTPEAIQKVSSMKNMILVLYFSFSDVTLYHVSSLLLIVNKK